MIFSFTSFTTFRLSDLSFLFSDQIYVMNILLYEYFFSSSVTVKNNLHSSSYSFFNGSNTEAMDHSKLVMRAVLCLFQFSFKILIYTLMKLVNYQNEEEQLEISLTIHG